MFDLALIVHEGAAPVVAGPRKSPIDSTLVEVHSENKQGAAAHFKGGFGFHPMLCAADGEPLSVMLRPGNAAANSIGDHIAVLDAAVEQLPAAAAAGHREGDGAAAAARKMQLRTDAAGCSTEIAAACRARNIEFLLTARSNAPSTTVATCSTVIEGRVPSEVCVPIRSGAAATLRR